MGSRAQEEVEWRLNISKYFAYTYDDIFKDKKK